MLQLSRRLDDRYRVLRYDRRGYGRSTPHARAVRHGRARSTTWSACCRPAGPRCWSATATAATSRSPLRSGTPISSPASAVYETPMSWEPWWPGTTAGAVRRRVGRTTRRGGRAVHAPPHRRRPVGGAARGRQQHTRRAEGAALVGELADSGRQRPWQPTRSRVPVLRDVRQRCDSEHHGRRPTSWPSGSGTEAMVHRRRSGTSASEHPPRRDGRRWSLASPGPSSAEARRQRGRGIGRWPSAGSRPVQSHGGDRGQRERGRGGHARHGERPD